MSYFVKMLGSSDMPMSNEPWGRDEEMGKQVRFPAHPAPTDVTRGDELIYYAVGGYKRIFGSSRIEAAPKPNPVHSNPVIAKRWPYAAPVSLRPSACLHYVSSGPLLEDVAQGLQSKVRHGVSHFEIGRPEFERAISLLTKAKANEDALRRRRGEH